MSAILKFLGALLLISIIAAAAGGAIGWHKTRALQRDGAQYVEINVPLIVANWNADEVIKRSAPEFLVPAVREGFPQVFHVLSQLGKLKSLGKPAGVVTVADFQVSIGDKAVAMPPQIRKPVWARYVVDAEFDAGPATLTMDLVRHDEGWQIIGFLINTK